MTPFFRRRSTIFRASSSDRPSAVRGSKGWGTVFRPVWSFERTRFSFSFRLTGLVCGILALFCMRLRPSLSASKRTFSLKVRRAGRL